MLEILRKIKHHGLKYSLNVGLAKAVKKYYYFKNYKAEEYKNPTLKDFEEIEKELAKIGVPVFDYDIIASKFQEFKRQFDFPTDYHGGLNSGVWNEKLLEHYIAYNLIGLDVRVNESDFVYVDVAACSSPWAKILRDKSITAYAIDLEINEKYKDFSFYKKMNATCTEFSDNSISAMSLQCAYEMFAGNDDIDFWSEVSRILKPAGKVVIAPLYMHTHYCSYATPEYYGKGYSDINSKEYIRRDCFGVPSSRKYDTHILKIRVLDAITRLGMKYKLHVVRNKKIIGDDIYVHFVLEVTK